MKATRKVLKARQDRLDKLTRDLYIINEILQENPTWTIIQKKIAKYTFCTTMQKMFPTEIIYEICLLFDRDIVDEITSSLPKLKENLNSPVVNIIKIS